MTKDETEGRIRAIEAVLLHLPEIAPVSCRQRKLGSGTLSGNPIRRLPK